MQASILGLLMVLAPLVRAGWVEDLPDKTVIHLKVWSLPDPSDPSHVSGRTSALIRRTNASRATVVAAETLMAWSPETATEMPSAAKRSATL